jgi:tRNA (mo5U34)-methyltransferase
VEAAELRARVAAIPWYHCIDLGQGVVTPGVSHSSIPSAALPDFRGRSVLDIGAWDGYYSFLAERGGAARVVALDHYVWKLDWAARQEYWARCAREGVLPDPDREAEFLDRAGLPGRRGFDLARDALESRVEPVVGDFMSMDLEPLGRFDVVLFLGVLYHLTEPFTALRRLRAVTRGLAVIETQAIQVSGHRGEPLLRFLAGDELNRDHTNWAELSEPALRAMCRASGFRRVETRVGPPRRPLLVRALRRVRDVAGAGTERARTRRWRIVVHAHAED